MRGCGPTGSVTGCAARHEARHSPRLRLAPLCSQPRPRPGVAELGVVSRLDAHLAAMSFSFLQLDSYSAGERFFCLLCARQFRFPVHARGRAMRLRSTFSQARRFAVRVRFSGEALAGVPGFAARRGFGRFLRAANLPVRVGALPSVLRATRALGRRFSARLQTRRASHWFVESFAAMRGDLSRFLRAGLSLLDHAASSSAKRSEPRFRNGRVSCGTPCSPITLRRRTKANKRLTMALQRTAPGGSGLSQPVLLRPARQPIRGSFPALHRWAQAAPALRRPPRSLSLGR